MMCRNRQIAGLLVIMSASMGHATYKNNGERNVLVELKGAYVLPAAHTFRDIYHNAGSCTAEVTGQLKQECPWFGFGSVGVVPLKGRSVAFPSIVLVATVAICT